MPTPDPREQCCILRSAKVGCMYSDMKTNNRQLYTRVQESDEPKIEPMRVVDVPKTVDDMFEANEGDPWMRYKLDGAGEWAAVSMQSKTAIHLRWLDAIRRREHWTINRGDSILVYSAAENSVPPLQRAANKFTRTLIGRLLGLFKPFYTKEQRKRGKEAAKKLEATTAESLGDRVPDLISLDNLATAKRAQQRGYASTLVIHLTRLADKQRRGIWLVTNERTESFYAQFGFKTAGQFSIGEDNPAWTEKPVIMCLMLREPKNESPDAMDENSTALY